MNMNSLYPDATPFNTGYLSVGDGHQLYFEQSGNPQGDPVVWLHGGPGAGCSFNESRYFNPAHFQVVMFDQRGTGKSTPYASVKNNSIQHLIDDMEKLRKHLNIKKWSVVGGSWGSALAMFYAKQHPGHVERLLLRGIFFGDQDGAAYIIEDGGANLLRDDYFSQYRDMIPKESRQYGLLQPYYDLLVHGTHEENVEAAKRFMIWDTALATYKVNEALLQEIRDEPEKSLDISRLFFHFARHEFKSDGRKFMLTPDKSIERIPIDIVHGEHDYICPVQNARDLYRAYPHSRLHILPETGHSMTEPALQKKFVEISNRWVYDSKLSPRAQSRGLHHRF